MNWGHPERGKVLLLAGDAALAFVAIALATIGHPRPAAGLWREAGLLFSFVGIYIVSLYVFDLYDVRSLDGIRTFARLVIAGVSGTCLLSLSLSLFPMGSLTRGELGIAIISFLIGSFAWRRVYKRHRSFLLKKRGVLFVGTAQDACTLQAIVDLDVSPYELLGFLRVPEMETAKRTGAPLSHVAPLAAAVAAGVSSSVSASTAVLHEDSLSSLPGPHVATGQAQELGIVSRTRLERAAKELGADTIVLRQNSAVPELAEALTDLRFQGVRISTLPDFCSQVLEELPIETLSDAWFSFATGFHLLHQKLFRKVKRLSDILFAVAGLLLTLPVSVIVALAVKLESPGPVLYRQWRVGWMERPFQLLKFRSMRIDAESDGKAQWAAASDPRATRAGRLFRLWHADEIPQMMNVLLGQMSFIGPRPERPEFVRQLKELVPFYSLRHHVPPGITGWAQVNYPYGASVEDAKRKLQYDLFYVRNASPTLDLRILLRTARVILFRRGSR